MADSRAAAESSRTWSSIPSATMMRRHAAVAIVVAVDRGVGAVPERGCERARHALLELVALHVGDLALDHLERLSFALPDLDREELQQMLVVIGRRGALALGMVEEPVRDVEADRARARRSARRRVRRTHPGRVHEGRRVRSESAGVPGGVTRVSAQQGDGRVRHRPQTLALDDRPAG